MNLVYSLFTLAVLSVLLLLALKNSKGLLKMLVLRTNEEVAPAVLVDSYSLVTLLIMNWLYVLPAIMLFVSTWMSMPALTQLYLPIPWVLLFYLPGLTLVNRLIRRLNQSKSVNDALEEVLLNLNWLCYLGMLYSVAILIVVWIGFLAR